MQRLHPAPTPTAYDHAPGRDLVLVAASTVLYFTAASHFEWSETVSRFTRGYERLQFDELPLTLVVFCIGLSWFAWRRLQGSRVELIARTRAQAEVARLLAHNRDLAQRLIVVQEDERRALARELHDEVGQHCTAIRADAAYIARSRAGVEVDLSAERIAGSAEALQAMVSGILTWLRPAALDSLGIESALRHLCEGWERQTGIACAFVPQADTASLDDATAVTLFRLVQEALTNVARHAGAEHVQVALGLSTQTRRVRLIVADDGQGLVADDALRRGFGLLGMQERVAALGGTIRFDGEPGKGLQIVAELPVAELPVAAPMDAAR